MLTMHPLLSVATVCLLTFALPLLWPEPLQHPTSNINFRVNECKTIEHIHKLSKGWSPNFTSNI